MKVLSIRQPWASLIAHGIKDIENRTWRTYFRGRIYIHASAVSAGNELQTLLTPSQYRAIPDSLQPGFLIGSWQKSAIIGEVDIIDCVINHESIWAENNKGLPEDGIIIKPIYNWVLANPVLYDAPILNVKGKLSFWEFETNNILNGIG